MSDLSLGTCSGCKMQKSTSSPILADILSSTRFSNLPSLTTSRKARKVSTLASANVMLVRLTQGWENNFENGRLEYRKDPEDKPNDDRFGSTDSSESALTEVKNCRSLWSKIKSYNPRDFSVGQPDWNKSDNFHSF